MHAEVQLPVHIKLHRRDLLHLLPSEATTEAVVILAEQGLFGAGGQGLQALAATGPVPIAEHQPVVLRYVILLITGLMLIVCRAEPACSMLRGT